MKVWNYVFIAITIMLTFHFTGISINDGIANFVSLTFNPDNSVKDFSLNFSGLFLSILTSVSTWVGAAIAIGLYATGKPDIAIKAGLATSVFAGFITTLYAPLSYALTNHMDAWAVGVLAMIFIPFSIGYIFALFEYIVGGNTD